MQNNIRALLLANQITMTELAERAGIRLTLLSRYTVGSSRPLMHNATRIADALGVKVVDVWPEYDKAMDELAVRRSETWRNKRIERERERKALAEYSKFKAERQEAEDTRKDNVVPLSLDLHAGDFHLRGGMASLGDLENQAWCLDKAQRLHRWLVGHCAWGVYRHLRQIMADENRLAENRRSTQ